MEYGISIKYFSRSADLAKTAERVAKAGFTMLDYTPATKEDNWAKEMKEALAIFDSCGLKVHQTHAPFNRYGEYRGMHEKCIDRCAEATEYLGAEFMAVHGDEFDFENRAFSPEAAQDYNHRLFYPYVEQAEKSGFKVAFETVFEDSLGVRRYTSRENELLELIRSFSSDHAVCCWDFGHANVSFNKHSPDVIRRFGSLIQCTHLHDNTGVDAHQIPLTGDIDWNAVMGAFKEIGYAGVTSIEYAHGKIPEELQEDFLRLSYRMAAHLWTL